MARPSPYEKSYRRQLCVLLLVLLAVPVAVWLFWGPEITVLLDNRKLARSYDGYESVLYQKADAVVKAAGGYAETAPQAACRGPRCAWIKVQVTPHSSRLPDYSASLDEDFGRIPAGMRAGAPGNVETVVLTFQRTYREGVYVPENDPGNRSLAQEAYGEVLEVYVVDLKNARFLGRKRFAWHPLSRIVESESRGRERDSKQVVDWYVGLPAK